MPALVLVRAAVAVALASSPSCATGGVGGKNPCWNQVFRSNPGDTTVPLATLHTKKKQAGIRVL